MYNKTTEELSNTLKQIRSKDDFESFITTNEETINLVSFSEYMEQYINNNNFSKSEIIHSSLINRTYAYQVLQGTKRPSRDKVVALCLACKMKLEEVTKCLTLSQNAVLYTKNKRDAIIIFAVNRNLSVIQTNELLHEYKEEILS